LPFSNVEINIFKKNVLSNKPFFFVETLITLQRYLYLTFPLELK